MAKTINSYYEIVGINELRPHPQNPRKGDVGAIYESIEANGFYGAIVAQKSTGHILAGNHRWKAAHEANLASIPVIWVECDDDRALRILLADNRANDKAGYDDSVLADILAKLSNESDLIGTGYTAADLDDLIAQMAVPDFAPGTEDEQGKLDELAPKMCQCPQCGHEFDLRKHGKADLRIDWATHAAAKFACENWHYSRCLPAGKLVKVGAWEAGKFIGVIVFGRGANCNIVKGYGLTQDQGCELVRVALTEHKATVSKIVSLAIRFLKSKNPGLQLIVSYADPEQGHHGGIYQAGNWTYRGVSSSATKVWYNGKWSHKKTVDDAGVDQTGLKRKKVLGKHTYLMPLDAEMRERILPLSKPYPKRVKQAMTGHQPEQRQGGTDPHAPEV